MGMKKISMFQTMTEEDRKNALEMIRKLSAILKKRDSDLKMARDR